MFLHDAVIHDHLQPALAGDPHCLGADHPLLQPQRPGAAGDRFPGDRRGLRWHPEEINQIRGLRQIGKRGKGLQAEDRRNAGD